MQAQFEHPIKTESLGKAARLHQFGQPLVVEDVSVPEAGPRTVLLRVRAAGICHSDIHLSNGLFPLKTPVTLGHEIAGDVQETGSEVNEFRKGDRAVVHFWSPCGSCKYCLEGRGMRCENLFARPPTGPSRTAAMPSTAASMRTG